MSGSTTDTVTMCVPWPGSGGNKEVELTQTDLRVSTLTCARLTVPCVYQLVGNLDTLHSGDDGL